MPRVFESNFCWKARVQTQAYLRGNTQMRNSTREKMARTHDIPNAKQLISGGNDFLTWSFQSLRRVKFSLLAWPLHWFSLPPLADESLNINILGWPKSFFRFFHRIFWKNPNKCFGQLNTSWLSHLHICNGKTICN